MVRKVKGSPVGARSTKKGKRGASTRGGRNIHRTVMARPAAPSAGAPKRGPKDAGIGDIFRSITGVGDTLKRTR